MLPDEELRYEVAEAMEVPGVLREDVCRPEVWGRDRISRFRHQRGTAWRMGSDSKVGQHH